MDLVQTIRKEGSRGGVNFSWSDVATSEHRQNYLGHSIMAPVGRWQKGRDLSWYARGNQEDAAADALQQKTEEDLVKEERRLIKEREEDEMRKALGLPALDRGEGNANLQPLGSASTLPKGLVSTDREPPVDERRSHRQRRTSTGHERTTDRERYRHRDVGRHKTARSRERAHARSHRSRSRSVSHTRYRDRRSRSRSRSRRRHHTQNERRRSESPRDTRRYHRARSSRYDSDRRDERR